jgi:hypothetical protein
VKTSIKQQCQRRAMTVIHITTAQDRREAERKMQQGHAKIGTDDDVRAYCARMGYAYGKPGPGPDAQRREGGRDSLLQRD